MPDPNPAADMTCTTCGAPMAVGERCAQCLLRLALEVDSSEADPFFEKLRWHGFGDYEVIEEIARGGMGVVYRARQRSLEREVALKMILAGELAGRKALRMFQTEAQAAANLHHPNIVPVYEIGEHEMQNYFTMRYVPGGRTVADWAATQRENPRAIAAVVAKIARAVAHAHERGVLHCDIKPSNVLWDPRGEPLVTDFGLAKLLDLTEPAMTYTAIVGSPSYMAPEQVDQKAGIITTATDVYGIGALLYEMLSGHPPFEGGSALEILRKVSQDAPRTITTVPRDLRVICMKSLEKRPKDRYSTAMALAEDLDRFARGEPVSAAPRTWAHTMWYWALRKPRSAALLVLCAISVLFGMTGIIMQWLATERANRMQAAALERVRWQEIEQWQKEGNSSQALTYLAKLIRQKPNHWQAAMYAMSIVDQTSLAVPAGPNITPPVASTATARLSADGQFIITAGSDAKVRIWEAESGKETRNIPVNSPVTEMATGTFVPLALATQRNEVFILPGLDKEWVTLPRGAVEPVKKVLFSANGHLLAAVSESKIEVWSMDDLSGAARSLKLDEAVEGMLISAEGSYLIGWNKTQVSVWDASTLKLRWSFRAHEVLHQATLSADGNTLAVVDGSYSVRIWEVAKGAEINVIASPLSSIRQVALCGDGSRLTMGGAGNELLLYDSKSGLPLRAATKHHYNVRNIVTDIRGKYVYSYGYDDALCVSDAVTGETLIEPFKIGQIFQEADIHPSHQGQTILVHNRAKNTFRETLSVWQGTRRKQAVQHGVQGQRDFHFSRMSKDGQLGCLALNPGDRCYIYDLKTEKILLDQKANGDVYATYFSPDMSKCYALTANGWIHGWTLATGKELWPPNQQPGKIRPAIITDDGTRLIAGHNDGHIRIYDTATGKVIQELEHPGEVKTLRLAPGGKELLLSGSTDKLAHVWDLRSGKKIQTFRGHDHTIIASGWSPDARSVATASYDRTARLWSVETGQSIGTPMQHPAWLSHVEFSPDGQLIATASRDGTARLWHAETSLPASLWMEQGSTCETVHFTQDGRALLIRDHSGFRFWDIERAQPLTIHYQEPVSGGLGMDSESHRSMMNADGTQVFLASNMNYGALWSISQPRMTAPSWFPDFIEALAGLNFDHPDTANDRRNDWLKLKEKLLEEDDQGGFEPWARKTLSSAPE
ncbi:protein kinase domain-containing protein [Prosthecobacter dejongeii]|uniref:WD40 repeat protein/predicted Ser/Thr protein kinase n=1 Tax=Prosthecobacter dejongeii TaxID=48465 RepID=A0A7W7YKP2_9BACT|nr:protein kinase [Prosthecobacter dejongeii]MBB5037695.1 WD40 repeat protein/predicted Ser/Thr protein kinase [Prosthecobacter dejongeii]